MGGDNSSSCLLCLGGPDHELCRGSPVHFHTPWCQVNPQLPTPPTNLPQRSPSTNLSLGLFPFSAFWVIDTRTGATPHGGAVSGSAACSVLAKQCTSPTLTQWQ